LFPAILLAILGSGGAAAGETPKEKVLFEENFTTAPDKSWSWFRESREDWTIDKERHELLLRSVHRLANLLLRTPPDPGKDPLVIEVHVNHAARADFELSALIWFFDDKNFVNVVQERMDDDKMHLFLARRKDGKVTKFREVILDSGEVDLRLVVTGSRVQGWYRTPGTSKWRQLAGEMEMPVSGPAKVGLRVSNAERDKPSWARYSKLRILQLGE
jgi:hypothetical protein